MPVGNSVTIMVPIADKATANAALDAAGFGPGNVATDLPIGAGSPTHAGTHWVMTDGDLAAVRSALPDATISARKSLGQIANRIDLVPNAEVALDENWEPIEAGDGDEIVIDGLTVTGNETAFDYDLVQVVGNVKSIIYRNLTFSGNGRALNVGAETGHTVAHVGIHACHFQDTDRRVFENDGTFAVTDLHISDCTGKNVNSTLFYFLGGGDTALIDNVDVVSDESFFATPSGGYLSIGVIRAESITVRDCLTENHKTQELPTGSVAMSYDLRCKHLVQERNMTKNCGVCTDQDLNARWMLHAKAGVPEGEMGTGTWTDCQWIVEKAHFDDLEVPAPAWQWGNTQYRDCVLDGCTIDLDRLIQTGASDRWWAGLKIRNSSISANTLEISGIGTRGLFWFEHYLDRDTAAFEISDTTMSFTEIVGDSNCLIRAQEMADGTTFTISNLTVTSPDFDYAYYPLPSAQGTVWTVTDSTVPATTEYLGGQP